MATVQIVHRPKSMPRMARGFKVSSHPDGAHVGIHASGLLDAYTGRRLRAEVAAQIDAGARHVELDAAEITFIDSGGLRVLTDTADDLEQRGGTLSFIRPSEAVVQVLEITNMSARFGV